ncbi:MAG: DUF1667 domain-containing protein [Eubacteriales bacterium]
MQKRNMTCIVCPVGCRMEVSINDDGAVTEVTNNACARGEKYAVAEITNPVRTLTSTVRLEGAAEAFLPVKTAVPISKNRLFDAMTVIRALSVKAPVKLGDVLTTFDGINIVACKSVMQK